MMIGETTGKLLVVGETSQSKLLLIRHWLSRVSHDSRDAAGMNHGCIDLMFLHGRKGAKYAGCRANLLCRMYTYIGIVLMRIFDRLCFWTSCRGCHEG